MLYTFAKAQYDQQFLSAVLENITEQDVIVLWQDGVLQAVKNPQIFATLPQVFALENDVSARAISIQIPQISLARFVELTTHSYPQVAL